MNRRQTLTTTLLCGLASATGCRREENRGDTAAAGNPKAATGETATTTLEGADLVAAKIEPNLEIRSLAGLRPFRPAGFVVRREEREGKTLIHNYGHGGGGMTLSWGTAHLAAQMAGPLAGLSCAVIGGGVIGLSTARLLQLRGARVTLYAAQLPPDTTSNVAGAQCWPVSVFDSSRRTPEFSVQYVEAMRFSFHYFQRLVGLKWGVRWMPNYYLSEGPPENGWISGPGGVLHEFQTGFQDFAPGQHLFPAAYARRFHTMFIDPSTYLPQLLGEVQGAGAKIEIRQFAQAQEILSLQEPVIFNCTGLGARDLFGDNELIPVKGQLAILMPQPEVTYNLITGPFYMFSRSDGLVLGGTFQRNEWDTTPQDSTRKWLLDGQHAVFQRMREIQRTGLPKP